MTAATILLTLPAPTMSALAPVNSSHPHRGCVAATAIIWGCSTGMLAIDLLFSTSAQSATAIAIALVAAAALSTMTVWLTMGKAIAIQAQTPLQE